MTVDEMVDEYLIACAAFDYALERVTAAINELPQS